MNLVDRIQTQINLHASEPDLVDVLQACLRRFSHKTNLAVLRNEVAACTSCPSLVACRSKTVFGEGNPHSEVMFIGEGPGRTEDEQGRPFVGEAGRLLTAIINACGWKRSQVYITNVVMCRPPNNRVPTAQEVANCRPFVDGQIRVVDPDFLVLLGSTATQALLGMPVSEARGRLHVYDGRNVVATWHPASVLYKETDAAILQAKREIWEDMKILLEFRKKDLKL